MTITEEIDNSWIEQFKEEDSEYNNFYKEKPTSVKLCFMYINKEKELVDTNIKFVYFKACSNLKTLTDVFIFIFISNLI